MPDLSATAAFPARERLPYDPASVVRHIASEIRQPLSTIESIAHYLNMVLPRTEAKARRQLAKLQQEVKHLDWIVADVQYFLRAAPAQLQLLDLGEVVSKELTEWCPEQAAGCTLLFERDLPPVKLDLGQIEHLLRNLTTFFRRISAPGRSISIQTYFTEGEVRLEISSSALVYSPADIEPLTELLGSRFPAGPGLALASARRIIEAHGASLAVRSEPPHMLTLVISFPPA